MHSKNLRLKSVRSHLLRWRFAGQSFIHLKLPGYCWKSLGKSLEEQVDSESGRRKMRGKCVAFINPLHPLQKSHIDRKRERRYSIEDTVLHASLRRVDYPTTLVHT